MIGTLPAAALADWWIAVICGTPTPETTRVVQIDPGPIPTFTASAPASIKRLGSLTSGHVSGDHLNVEVSLDSPHGLDHVLAVTMRRIDNQDINISFQQRGRFARNRERRRPPRLAIAPARPCTH